MRVRLSINLFLIYTALPLSGFKSWPNQHCVRHHPATHTGKPLSPECLQPGALAQESMCIPAIPDSKHSKSLILSQLGQKWKMPGLNRHCFKFSSFLWLPYVQHSGPASSQPLGNLEGKALGCLGLVKCSLKWSKCSWYSKGNHADKKSI